MIAALELLRFGLKNIVRLDPDSEQGRLAALALAEAVPKTEASEDRLEAIDDAMLDMNAMRRQVHPNRTSEFRYEFSEDNDLAIQLLCERTLLANAINDA